MTMEEWKAQKSAAATAEAEKKDEIKTKEKTASEIKVKEKNIEEVPEYIAPQGDGLPTAIAGEDAPIHIALFLGILSVIFGIFFGGAPWIGIITGVGSIIFGALSIKKKDKNEGGKHISGLVCGITGVVTSLLVWLGCTALDISALSLKFIFSIF